MKTTRYFQFVRVRPDRVIIKEQWIEKAITHPICEAIQEDGRIRRWTQIEEAGGKFLRVVLLDDGETVHNAFFDRGFKEPKP